MKTLSLKPRQARPAASAYSLPLAAQPPSPSPRLPVSPSPSLSSFDPTLPQDGALVVAEVLRDQFNGLAGMIAAVPTISAAQVDGVTTLPAGDPATVSAYVAGGVLYLTFGIPQGQEGQTGQEGQVGPQGPPGEVTLAQLDAATAATLSLTSSNSNAVAVLGEIADSSYSQPQMQNLINKVDELILALRR